MLNPPSPYFCRKWRLEKLLPNIGVPDRQSHGLRDALLLVGTVLLVLVLLSFALAPTAIAQGLIDQAEVSRVTERHSTVLNEIPEVHYNYYVLDGDGQNTVRARHVLYRKLGNGNIEKGRTRARIVTLLNRTTPGELAVGDTLVIPTRFDVDFRAFSPFPRYYPGGHMQDKLLVLNKNVQAWAAYEHGKLARWGIANTGALDTPTPNGRFNINWKEERRVSTESPQDEEWTMHWVMNIHDRRGIHLHQYSMPTGGPTSHGCVRLVDGDARWLYQWTNTWHTTSDSTGAASRRGKLLRQGTMVLVLGDEPATEPRPFLFKARYPILKRIDLPTTPCDVPPGSPQQKTLDRC